LFHCGKTVYSTQTTIQEVFQISNIPSTLHIEASRKKYGLLRTNFGSGFDGLDPATRTLESPFEEGSYVGSGSAVASGPESERTAMGDAFPG
jgi:hypothetical protein